MFPDYSGKLRRMFSDQQPEDNAIVKMYFAVSGSYKNLQGIELLHFTFRLVLEPERWLLCSASFVLSLSKGGCSEVPVDRPYSSSGRVRSQPPM